jgi:hypothetical protein
MDHILNKIQNHNFAFRLVWVWNLDSDITGKTQTECIWEQGAEDKVLSQ